MINIEKAMKLKKSSELLEAAQAAEAANCEQAVIKTLYIKYYDAVEKEERERGRKR